MIGTNHTRRALGLAFALAVISGPARATIDVNLQMALGNPSHATISVLDEQDYLIRRPQYALSYSRYDGICRWVSWHLTSDDVGGSGRGSYTVDNSLPTGWQRTPTQAGWNDAGYDRGHMCPSGDRTKTAADNDQVFLMTNLIPQASGNNQGPWNNLEMYCRTLASAGNELYIICGGRGFKETIVYNGTVQTTAPSHTWKVIVVLPLGTNDIARINTSTRVIAVDMPNTDAVVSDWKTYRTTTDFIESQTGLDFLSNVPTAIQNVIEARVDTAN